MLNFLKFNLIRRFQKNASMSARRQDVVLSMLISTYNLVAMGKVCVFLFTFICFLLWFSIVSHVFKT